MRIIRTIIFCAGMVVYSSTMAQASVNNNQTGGLSNNPDATLIEKNQNRFEFGPQTLSLELPDAGSVSVKNFPRLAKLLLLPEISSLTSAILNLRTLMTRFVRVWDMPRPLVPRGTGNLIFAVIAMPISNNAVPISINIRQTVVHIRMS